MSDRRTLANRSNASKSTGPKSEDGKSTVSSNATQQKLMLPERALMLLTRYQTTLDNQIYKALRSLREAQEWRLKTIEGLAAQEDEVDCDSLQ